MQWNIAQKYFYRRDLLNIVQIIYDTFFTSSENFCLFFSSIFQLKNMETYVSLEIDKQSHFATSTA